MGHVNSFIYTTALTEDVPCFGDFLADERWKHPQWQVAFLSTSTNGFSLSLTAVWYWS